MGNITYFWHNRVWFSEVDMSDVSIRRTYDQTKIEAWGHSYLEGDYHDILEIRIFKVYISSIFKNLRDLNKWFLWAL